MSTKKRTNRAADTFRDLTERKLTVYAAAATAAGVGLTAVVPAAQARVIFTPANQPIARNTTYQLDLNNDGIPDFTLSNYGTTVGLRAYGDLVANPQTGGFRAILAVKGNRHANQPVRGIGSIAADLPPGEMVGPSLTFFPKTSDNHEMEGCQFSFDTTRTTYYGSWKNVAHRYLGLRFKINGENHYGWARLRVSSTHCNIQATLTGYAYETHKQKGLITGDKGQGAASVKSDGLGHLALGAKGKK